MTDERIHVFSARDLTRRTQSPDEGEIIAGLRGFGRRELLAMMSRGEIKDAKSLIGLFYALNVPIEDE